MESYPPSRAMNMKKILKRIALVLGVITLIVSITAIAFMNLSPQFGGKISKEQKKIFEELAHYSKGKFINDEPFEIQLDCHSVTEMVKEAFSSIPNTVPEKNIEVESFDVNTVNNLDNKTRITWLGHSSFLIEIDGKTILLDPVFSDYAAPHKLLGRKRFNNKMPFAVEDLKTIDAVIISHDHYDHLDYPTISKIKDKIQHVIVPLGVGCHFREWGIEDAKIQELDWWQETALGDLKVVCTPSRHASGRGISDQSATLWSSWCFLGGSQNIYFSGDGGYGKHFKKIGETYGPFDYAMMECGQYDVKWAGMHMMPEETIQAGIDVRAKIIQPIHWGAFRLANHTWTDPVERASKEALKKNIPIATPKVGESIIINDSTKVYTNWWTKF